MTQEQTAEAVIEPAQAETEKPKTPTIEELTARLAQYEKDLISARNEAKAHQKFGQEKVAELKTQADLRAEIKGIREDMELLAVGLATKGTEENLDGDGKSRQDILAELQKRRAASEAKLKADAEALAYQEKATILSGYQKRVEALGLTEEDDDYGDIYRLVRTLDPVDLKTAERRLLKLEASKGKPPIIQAPKETEEDRVTRLVKEQLARDYPNMYASDTGLPSGGKPASATDAMAKYGRGEITAEDAKKYGVKFD